MTRQYLNDQHVAEEKKLMNILQEKWDCKIDHQNKFAAYDCVAHRSRKPLAFIELRIRNYGYYEIPDIMISLSKLIVGRQQTDITGIPSLFVVWWKKTDDIGWIDVNKIPLEPNFNLTQKNTNRINDPNEIEVCRNISSAQFKMIEHLGF